MVCEAQTESGERVHRLAKKAFFRIASLVAVAVFLVGCGQSQPMWLEVVADKERRLVSATGSGLTVRDILNALDLSLGPLDRVEPDLYILLSDDMTITLTRVTQTFETERIVIPFERRTVRSEGIEVGEQRLAQAGRNGEVEVTYQVTLENGIPVLREELSRQILVEPAEEVMVIGVQGELASVPVSGTIAYISGNNAWLIREESGLRRNLTGSSDLDGRVFDLSDDGSQLLFTRGVMESEQGPLNSLWVAETSLIGEGPVSLDQMGVIWAQWSPDGSRIAYSTAERVGGVPGWKANNDLWLLSIDEGAVDGGSATVNVLPATADIPYAWWGRSFEWAPSGDLLAYAQANEVGTVSLAEQTAVPIASFPEYRTRSSWAWVPELSWAADGSLLAFVAHEPDGQGVSEPDSASFALWAASSDGRFSVRLQEEVGMWAAPRWAPSADGPIAFGQAQSPLNSQDSRYEILLVDRDGSNRRQLYPGENQLGLIAPDVAWSPNGNSLLLADRGNLFVVNAQTGASVQLTSDGQGSHPRWAR